MTQFGSVDFSADADVVAEREAILAEMYAAEDTAVTIGGVSISREEYDSCVDADGYTDYEDLDYLLSQKEQDAERQAVIEKGIADYLAKVEAESWNARHSAKIIGVTPAEWVMLDKTARNRGECPCLTCLVGEGDLLCVACHYRYANCGNMCTKCYSYESYCQQEDAWAARVNELGAAFGVENAWEKFQAEQEAERESWTAANVVEYVADARGRVYAF